MTLPKFWVSIALHSPLEAKLVKSQSGTRLPFVSTHVRVVAVPSTTRVGLTAWGKPPAWLSIYLPRLHLTAVLPLPSTSHDTPNRGEMSFQFGTLGIAAKSRAPRYRTGPWCGSGADAATWPYRM